MGHRITALIGLPEAFVELTAKFGPPGPKALPFGLAILALDEDRLDQLARFDAQPHSGFIYLVPALEEAIGKAISDSRVLYVETDYFGGAGSQGAALFDGGQLVWRRSSARVPRAGRLVDDGSQSPISRGLSDLGVRPDSGLDEFDAVGLGRFRSMDDFEC